MFHETKNAQKFCFYNSSSSFFIFIENNNLKQDFSLYLPKIKPIHIKNKKLIKAKRIYVLYIL